EIGTELDEAKEQAADLGEADVTGALAAAGDELAHLRALLSSDPLALWRGSGVDTTRLDRLRQQAAAAVARAGGLVRLRQDAQRHRDAERAATALLRRRDELRGLLDAYQAKAARLGAAEDIELAAHYRQASDLLWTAPCDLAAATAAVTRYQQAILALSERRQ